MSPSFPCNGRFYYNLLILRYRSFMFVVISGKKREFTSSFRRWYLLKAYFFLFSFFLCHDVSKQKRIEESFTKGRSFHKFKRGGEDHKLFFHKTSMYQQNSKPPIKVTKVRRRPLFRSKSEIERLQR